MTWLRQYVLASASGLEAGQHGQGGEHLAYKAVRCLAYILGLGPLPWVAYQVDSVYAFFRKAVRFLSALVYLKNWR